MKSTRLLLLPFAALLCGACYTQLRHPDMTAGTRIASVEASSDCRACHDGTLFHDDPELRWWQSFGSPGGSPGSAWTPGWVSRAERPWWRDEQRVASAGRRPVVESDDAVAPPPVTEVWQGRSFGPAASGRHDAPQPAADVEEPLSPPAKPEPKVEPAVKSPRKRPAAADSSRADKPGKSS